MLLCVGNKHIKQYNNDELKGLNMNRNLITMALILTLSACGGSGGSSNSNTESSNNTSQSAGITVKAVYLDACGNETNATDAALLIHNNDYSNKQVIKANTSGEMRYSSSNATETVSLIMRGERLVDGIKPISLTTYIDQPVIDMGKIIYRTSDKSACNCQYVNLTVNVPSRASDTGTANFDGQVNNPSVSNYQGFSTADGVEQCAKAGQAMPLVSSHVNFNNPNESFGALFSDVSQVDSVEASLQGSPVSIVSADYNKQIAALIGDTYHFRSYAYAQTDNVYAYPAEQIDFYSIDAYDFEDLDYLPDVESAYIFTVASTKTTNINQTFDLPRVTIDYTELLGILASDSGSYSLSNSSQFDYMTVSVTGFNPSGEILDWYMYAPTSGNVPKIENIDLSEFISDSDLSARVESLSMAVGARGYDGISSYDDFLRSKVDRKIQDFAQEKWANTNRVNFRMRVSAAGLSSVANTLTEHTLLTSSIEEPSSDNHDEKARSVNKLPSRELIEQELHSER